MRTNSLLVLAAINALVGAAPAAAAWVHRLKWEAASQKTAPNGSGARDAVTVVAADEPVRRAA